MDYRLVVGVVLVMLSIFLVWLWKDILKSTREHDRKKELGRCISAAVRKGPFFAETTKGNTLVLVRYENYRVALEDWEQNVRSGERSAGQKILFDVDPAFTFHREEASRADFSSVGSWEDAQKLKWEALRLASGLTEEEFGAAKGNFYSFWDSVFTAVSQKTTHIRVKAGEASTLEKAREYLFAGLPKPEQE